MVMDAKNIQSDLHALKRLYGLLRNDGDGTSNADSDQLDERSRAVLKNLLDAATKRVLLKVHLEVVAGPTEESQSCEQGKDTDRGLQVTTFLKENCHEGGVSAQKRCRVCQRNTVKQLESMHIYDDEVASSSSNTFTDVQKNEPDYCLWNSDQELKINNDNSDESKSDKGGKQRGPYVKSNLDGTKMCDFDGIESTSSKPDCLSKEASEAIKQTELCTSSFHREGADQQLQQLFEKNYYCVPETKSSAMPKQYMGEDNFMTTSNLLSSQRVVNPIGFPMYYLLPPNPPYLSLSQTYRLFEPTKAMLRQPSKNNSFIRRGGEPALQSDMSGKSRDQCKFPTKKKSYSQNVKAIVNRIEPGKCEMSPDQCVTCLQHKDGTSRNRTCLQHQESESTDTDSYQQSSSSSHDSDTEDSSFTDKTGELQYMRSSSRSSGSWGGGSTGGQNSSSCTSNSEEEIYSSSSSGDGAPQITSSSSYNSKSEGSTPKKSGPSRIHGAYGINHEKHFGVWKRLKDRLAVVFHHNRHHHYGHRTNDERKMSRNISLGKRQGKIINFKRQDGEVAVEKMNKSVIHEKKHHSHFHGLVEGLLRHVGHSKLSKSGKGKDKRHGRNKTLNKSHWWQLLQHHHRGAKFPHGKLGLGKEKARLKALPNIK